MVGPTTSPESGDGANVCLFTTAHDATDSRVVNREAAALESAGYDVTYYTPFRGDGPVDVVSYGDAPEGSMLPLRTRVWAALAVVVALYGTDYDVYHFHDFEALPAGVFLGAITGATVIYDVHENVEDTLRHKPIFPRPLRPLASRLGSAVERVLSRFVDGIVVASPDIADRFAGRDDVTVVTNYPQRRWAEGTSPPEHIDPDETGDVEFVYRGLLSEGRGILTLIDAVEQVPEEHDVRLVLGGKYDSAEARDRIEPRIAAADRVEFVEWLPTLGDVIDQFRRADVGLMCFHPAPNKTNAAHRSNKLFQYMSAGLPVVISDIGNWTDVVEDADCGVAVDPEDPEAVADAMVELVEDPDRRAALGRNGYRAALEQYNWETQQEALLSAYRRLTSDSPASDRTPGAAGVGARSGDGADLD